MKFFGLFLSVLAVNVMAAPALAPADAAAVAEPADDACADVCGLHRVEGAHNEREALCSAEGLRATLACAECIDTTWPDTTWEDSAMAEYDRILSACEAKPQRVFRNKAAAHDTSAM
ncbi:hypothetical protein Q5752_000308 [Cryptotrichosporon argae]